MKILLIDDSAAYQEEFGLLLATSGIRVSALDFASNSAKGALLLAENAHDIYFVDYRLPGDNGLVLIQAARSAGMRKPIIVLTADDNPKVDADAESLGANDYLQKGEFSPNLLGRAIRYACRNASSADRTRDAVVLLKVAQGAVQDGIVARCKAEAANLVKTDSLAIELASLQEVSQIGQADLLASEEINERLVTLVEERTAALAQRDILLREVYHRVKNNMQVVDSLLSLHAMNVQSPDGKRALASVRSRFFALALVHEQLMGSEDLKTFDLDPFLQQLCQKILADHQAHDIRFIVSSQPIVIGIDAAIALAMIANELVTNSLQHAFGEDPGTISVTVRAEAHGTINLTVSDDGKKVASVGPKAPAPSGVGSMIVRGLVSQLGGTMTSQVLNGTTTEIKTSMVVDA